MSPNLDTIPEFIIISGPKGQPKKIPNPDHPKNKIKIPPKTVNITKTKLR
jgi:hypothetical protein